MSAFCRSVIPVTATIGTSCQLDNTLDGGASTEELASIQLAYGHVYEAFSELLLDANAGGSSPLWVVPSQGLDCARTLAGWARGSKLVSSIPPGSLLQFLSGAPAQGCPDGEPWPVSIINPFLSTLLLIMVYQALQPGDEPRHTPLRMLSACDQLAQEHFATTFN